MRIITINNSIAIYLSIYITKSLVLLSHKTRASIFFQVAANEDGNACDIHKTIIQ